MKDISYKFLSKGEFQAEPSAVWEVISKLEDMPLWWPGVRSVKVRGGDKVLRKGAVVDCAVKGLLGDLVFTLIATEVVPNKLLILKSTGDLRGEGECLLERKHNGFTEVKFKWNVTTTGFAMNLFGILLKPLLAANHDRVMQKGYEVIKKRLEGGVPAFRAGAVKPSKR